MKLDNEVSDMLFGIIAKKLFAKTRECESLYDYIKELEKFRADTLAKKDKVAYYARVPEWDRWTPIEDTLPKSGKRVLVKLENNHVSIATYYYICSNNVWKDDSANILKTVVLWKELDE